MTHSVFLWLPANGSTSFIRFSGRFLRPYEPHCFAMGSWVSHLLIMGCIPFTRPPPWPLHQLHAVCLEKSVFVNHDHGFEFIICTSSQQRGVSNLWGRCSGGEEWSGSGWRQWEGDVKESDMASPSTAKFGLSSFPTSARLWLFTQDSTGCLRLRP